MREANRYDQPRRMGVRISRKDLPRPRAWRARPARVPWAPKCSLPSICSFVSCPLSKFAGVQMLLLISPPPHPLTGHRHTTATEPTRDTHAERGQQQGLEQSTCRGGSFRFGCAESNRLRVRALPRNHRRDAVIAAQAAQVQCRRKRPRGCGPWRRRRRFCRECRRPPTRSRSEFAE